MKRWFYLLVVLVIALPARCSRHSPDLNVVIIGIDTLRRDHLGCYGYRRAISPSIDRLAAEGVLFEDVVSQAPWTLPSFASVFTSLYPSEHRAGIHERTGKGQSTGAFGGPLSPKVKTLAELLSNKGYATGAFINSPTLSREFKIDRGFETYNVPPNWKNRNALETSEQALQWIDEHKDRHFFLFLHYFDPHVPYDPPPPYDTLFDPNYRGRIAAGFDRQKYLEMKPWLLETDEGDVRAAWKHIIALYDGEIAFTDSAIGIFLAGLKRRNLEDKTLIVLLSDHGEEFLEHGGFEHGHTLYEELIRVPLIFSLPGELQKGKRIQQQVRLIDVMPTVLELLGVDYPGAVEGVSLLGLMQGKGIKEQPKATLPPGFAYSECTLYGTERKALVAYPWKVIFDLGLSKLEVFNLESDPAEQSGILKSDTTVIGLLEGALFSTIYSTSPCWNIEFAGKGNYFDVGLRLVGLGRSGDFKLWSLFDDRGRLQPQQAVVRKSRVDGDAVLTIKDFDPRGRIRLSVLAEPFTALCEFDVQVDTKRSIERIFIGHSLKHPSENPFRLRMHREDVGEGEPDHRPKKPYVLIWHRALEQAASGLSPISEETRRKLKALGYLQ